MLNRLPRFLRNRYVLVTVIFVVYIAFFDSHDMISQMKIRGKIKVLQNEIEYLENDSREAAMRIDELTSDREALEKFAREKYYLKKENEDIYIIEHEDSILKKRENE